MWTLALMIVVLGPILMLIGLTIMLALMVGRRPRSVAAARMLILGPGVGLVGGALLAAQLPVDLALRLAVIVTAMGLAVPCFVAAARVTYAER